MIRLCRNKTIIILFSLFLVNNVSFAGDFSIQNSLEKDSINQSRLIFVGSSMATAYVASLILLDQAWYKDFPRSSFHFHDDNKDWLQIDKLGHSTTSYYLSNISFKAYKWAGLNNNQAAIWGGVSGWIFLSAIEIMDGFSSQWGASSGDIIANTAGVALFASQQILLQDQKIKLKFSFSDSGLSKYRPDLLGSNLAENILKDYNGQTYWLSFNLNSLTGNDSNIPQWLNLAVGYGAYGMLGSSSNPDYLNGRPLPYYDRTRHWYLSPDIDYSKINTDSEVLKSIFALFDFIKMPAPAIEYSKKHGFTFHFMFF